MLLFNEGGFVVACVQFGIQLVLKKSYTEEPAILMLISKTAEVRQKWMEAIQLAR